MIRYNRPMEGIQSVQTRNTLSEIVKQYFNNPRNDMFNKQRSQQKKKFYYYGKEAKNL